MRATAWFGLDATDERVALGPGDVIGRGECATLRLDDPRISEAHAMVSLRGGGLVLLALRGRFRVRSKVLAEVALEPSLAVELAPGLTLTCDAVELPPALLGLRVEGLGTQSLVGTTSLFVRDGAATLRAGFDEGASAVVWTLGGAWRVRVGDGEAMPLTPGDALMIDGVSVEAVAVPVDAANRTRTRPSLRDPMVLRVSAGGVQITPSTPAAAPGGDVRGVPGRILATLLANDGEMAWRDLCAIVWDGDRSAEDSLRNRLDVGLARLRDRLRALGVTELSVALDGAGFARVRIAPQDRVELDGT